MGWILTILGLVALVAATLTVTSAAYGTQVLRGFARRRSYDMIKPEVWRVLPVAAAIGLVGLALMVIGARLRRRAGRD